MMYRIRFGEYNWVCTMEDLRYYLEGLDDFYVITVVTDDGEEVVVV